MMVYFSHLCPYNSAINTNIRAKDVMLLGTKERILMIRLAEKASRHPDYAAALFISSRAGEQTTTGQTTEIGRGTNQ